MKAKNLVLFSKYGKQFVKATDNAKGITFELFLRKASFSVKYGRWNPYLKVLGMRKSADERSYIITIYVHPYFYTKGDAFNMYRIKSITDICTEAVDKLIVL